MPKSANKKLRNAAINFRRNEPKKSAYYQRECDFIARLILNYGPDYRESAKALEEAACFVERVRREQMA